MRCHARTFDSKQFVVLKAPIVRQVQNRVRENAGCWQVGVNGHVGAQWAGVIARSHDGACIEGVWKGLLAQLCSAPQCQ